jgi:hypothetical protein
VPFIELVIVILVRRSRENARQVIFDVDAELGGQLRDMDAEDGSQFSKCVFEDPSCGSHRPWTWVASQSKVVGSSEELAAGSTHSTKMRSDVIIVVVQVAKLTGQEPAYLQDRLNTVLGNLNVPGREEHSAVLEEGKHAAGRDDLCLARIPVHAENGARETREASCSFREFQNAPFGPEDRPAS